MVGVVRAVAVFCAGLAAGILLGDRLGASFARREIPSSSFVTFQQVQHSNFVVLMPTLIGVTVLSLLVWLVRSLSRRRSSELSFLALACLAFLSVAVISRTVNVPINEQLMSWNAAAPPPDVRAIWTRWERAHTVRTAIALVGFACALAASRAVGSKSV